MSRKIEIVWRETEQTQKDDTGEWFGQYFQNDSDQQQGIDKHHYSGKEKIAENQGQGCREDNGWAGGDDRVKKCFVG